MNTLRYSQGHPARVQSQEPRPHFSLCPSTVTTRIWTLPWGSELRLYTKLLFIKEFKSFSNLDIFHVWKKENFEI